MTQVMVQASLDRYIPAINEPYMSEAQVAYFKEKLIRKKDELIRKLSAVIEKIKTLESVQADLLDRSSSYIDIDLAVKSFERYSNMMDQVDHALERIMNGRFGYCELTGFEIGLRRLEAIPFAAMSIKALEAFEAGQPFLS